MKNQFQSESIVRSRTIGFAPVWGLFALCSAGVCSLSGLVCSSDAVWAQEVPAGPVAAETALPIAPESESPGTTPIQEEAQEVKDFKPLNGAQYRSQLSVPVAGLMYTQTPAGEALGRFTQMQQLAWTLDRRVPSDSMLSITVQNTAVQDFLYLATDKLNWGVTFPDGVVYVGPKEYTEKLRTLLTLLQDRVRKLPTGAQTIWVKRRPLEWEEGTNPRDLLKLLAKDADVQIYGLDKIQHDIWAAGQWPAISLFQKVQLIVGQFGLTYRFDKTGRKIELIPLQTEKVVLIRSYPAGSNVAQKMKFLQEALPQVEFKEANNKIFARGLAEDLDRISPTGRLEEVKTAGNAQPQENAANTIEIQRMTLKQVKAPLNAILGALCKQANLELLVDWEELRAAELAPEKVILFEANNLTIDELCDELGKAAGCRIERRGKILQVLPN